MRYYGIIIFIFFFFPLPFFFLTLLLYARVHIALSCDDPYGLCQFFPAGLQCSLCDFQ